MSLNVDVLNELQKSLDLGRLPAAEECGALVAEIWRLKTQVTGKSIEARTARDEVSRLETQLQAARAENEALRREIEEMKAVHGLPVCELEQRWSNCAVRMRKCGAGGPD